MDRRIVLEGCIFFYTSKSLSGGLGEVELTKFASFGLLVCLKLPDACTNMIFKIVP